MKSSRIDVVLQRVVLRGIEGMISDRYLEKLVKAEWRDANEAEEAMRNNFESRHMAEAVFSKWKGWDK